MLFFRGYEGDDPGVPVPQAEGEVLCFSSLTMHRTGPNETQGQRRSWVVQHCDAATRHRETGELFDDRLLLSRNGEILDPPERHRPFDLSKLVKAANKAR
jgi:ectoine hydroxylase-related dioxygenase (phytanoyl-CoA dioxygenase family)